MEDKKSLDGAALLFLQHSISILKVQRSNFKSVKWILVGALVLIFIVIAIWHWSRVNDVDQARTIIQTSGNIGELTKRVKKDKEGYYFLDFTLAKGDSIQYFKEYRKLDAKTVRIYIGKELK